MAENIIDLSGLGNDLQLNNPVQGMQFFDPFSSGPTGVPFGGDIQNQLQLGNVPDQFSKMPGGPGAGGMQMPIAAIIQKALQAGTGLAGIITSAVAAGKGSAGAAAVGAGLGQGAAGSVQSNIGIEQAAAERMKQLQMQQNRIDQQTAMQEAQFAQQQEILNRQQEFQQDQQRRARKFEAEVALPAAQRRAATAAGPASRKARLAEEAAEITKADRAMLTQQGLKRIYRDTSVEEGVSQLLANPLTADMRSEVLEQKAFKAMTNDQRNEAAMKMAKEQGFDSTGDLISQMKANGFKASAADVQKALSKQYASKLIGDRRSAQQQRETSTAALVGAKAQQQATDQVQKELQKQQEAAHKNVSRAIDKQFKPYFETKVGTQKRPIMAPDKAATMQLDLDEAFANVATGQPEKNSKKQAYYVGTYNNFVESMKSGPDAANEFLEKVKDPDFKALLTNMKIQSGQ